MTSVELAQEFTELWDSLGHEEINTMLAKNVSFDLLEFFVSYAESYAKNATDDAAIIERLGQELPNLLVIGYLIRLLEERVK